MARYHSSGQLKRQFCEVRLCGKWLGSNRASGQGTTDCMFLVMQLLLQSSSSFLPRYIYFGIFFFRGGIFFWSWCVRVLSAFGSLAFRPDFGFLFSLASWFFGFCDSWPFDFLQLCCLVRLVRLLVCLASWLFGLSTCWPRLLIASRIILYYVVLNYIK